MAECIYIPRVDELNKEKKNNNPSKLFRDLVKITGDREKAKVIWGLSKVPGLLSRLNLDLEYDENGEPTAASLDRSLDFSSIFGGKTSLLTEKRNVGATDKEGNPIEYSNPQKLYDKIEEYNDRTPYVTAYPVLNNDKYTIDVAYRTKENEDKVKSVVFHNELNRQLQSIMRKLGFDVQHLDSTNKNKMVAGLFNPMFAEDTSSKLKTVIKVSKGILGEEAFPEEYAHFAIEGLKNHPLVQRLLKYVSDNNMAESILGDDYEDYVKQYNGDVSLLNKEAAGKLLYSSLTGTKDVSSLADRLAETTKDKFALGSVDEINNIVTEAHRMADQLSSVVTDEEQMTKAFDADEMLNGKALYHLSGELNSIKDYAEKASSLEIRNLNNELKKLRINSEMSEKQQSFIKNKRGDIYKKIKEINTQMLAARYKASCATFLTYTTDELSDLISQVDKLNERDILNCSVESLNSTARVCNNIKRYLDGYRDIVKAMKLLPFNKEKLGEELSESDAKDIAGAASKVSNMLDVLENNYQKVSRLGVLRTVGLMLGSDKVLTMGKNKGDIITAQSIVDEAHKDIGFMDRWLKSMSGSNDMLLQVVAKLVNKRRAGIASEMNDILIQLRVYDKKLKDSGSTSDFMFERDEKGNPVRLASNYDFDLYNKDYREKVQKINDSRDSIIKEYRESRLTKKIAESMSDDDIFRLQKREILKAFKKLRFFVNPDTGDGHPDEKFDNGRYFNPHKIDNLGWTREQREYYDNVMELKHQMDGLVPGAQKYKAIQIRNKTIEMIENNVSDPRKVFKQIISETGDKFVRRETDIDEFGNIVDKDMQLDMDLSGEPLRSVPVYYIRRLDDASRLSTDMTGALASYAKMAINYSEMNKIVETLEMVRSYAENMDIQQMSGDKQIKGKQSSYQKFIYSSPFTKKGQRLAERINDYMNMAVYGEKKKDEGVIHVPFINKDVDKAKTFDAIKQYSSITGLGLNMFSGISNVTVGKMQLFIESCAKQYFSHKNLMTAEKNYWKDLPEYMNEINSAYKKSKMSLIMDRFDVLEDFLDSMSEREFKKSALARILGNANIYMMQGAGEHYLHLVNAYAMLDAMKVTDKDGKEKSMYDALKVQAIKDDSGNILSHRLVIESGTRYQGKDISTSEARNIVDRMNNKQTLTQEEIDSLDSQYDKLEKVGDLIDNTIMKIHRVSESMNGGFSITDLGAINNRWYGRMMLQFRQWMIGHYQRRYGSTYYDLQLDTTREGFYRTANRFFKGLALDAKRGKFEMMTRWNELSLNEKQNMYRLFSEMGQLVALYTTLAIAGSKLKNNGYWSRQLAYHLYRMRMDTSASSVYDIFNFISNSKSLLNSPIPASEQVNNLLDWLELWNLFTDVQSGEYKGHSVYYADSMKHLPLIGQVKKAVDLGQEDYMFNLFKTTH